MRDVAEELMSEERGVMYFSGFSGLWFPRLLELMLLEFSYCKRYRNVPIACDEKSNICL